MRTLCTPSSANPADKHAVPIRKVQIRMYLLAFNMAKDLSLKTLHLYDIKQNPGLYILQPLFKP